MIYRRFVKRLLDIIISGTALLVSFPILVIVAVWLHFANKGAGVFFFQERPGKNAKTFKIWKFKSMNDLRDENGELLPDKDRLTAAGIFVRKTSIDELPQLWNVLKGDMSLIGPRPLLHRYLPYYTEEESHRHDVRPGITGWAQVNGRNYTRWDDVLAYDVEYVKNLSFLFDLKILLITVRNVLSSKDVEVAPNRGFFDEVRKAQLQEKAIIDKHQ